jgi:excisionase family DNA binding protein
VSELLTLRDVCQRLKLSAPTVYALIREGRFPEPIKVRPQTSRWASQDIEDYIATLRASRSLSPAPACTHTREIRRSA